mgnify:FL=1
MTVTEQLRSGKQGTMTGAAGMKRIDSNKAAEEAPKGVSHGTPKSVEPMMGAKTVRRDEQQEGSVTEMFRKMELSEHDGAELLDPVDQSRNMDEAGASAMKSAACSDTETEPERWDAGKQMGASGSRRISFSHPSSDRADSDDRLTHAADDTRRPRKPNRRKHKQAQRY